MSEYEQRRTLMGDLADLRSQIDRVGERLSDGDDANAVALLNNIGADVGKLIQQIGPSRTWSDSLSSKGRGVGCAVRNAERRPPPVVGSGGQGAHNVTGTARRQGQDYGNS